MGCTIILETYALEQEDIAYFHLSQKPVWELAITYRKGHYLSEPAKAFIRSVPRVPARPSALRRLTAGCLFILPSLVKLQGKFLCYCIFVNETDTYTSCN